MMKKMGFGERLIFLIMMYVTSVTYSILINGDLNLPILVLVVWGRLVGNDKKEREGRVDQRGFGCKTSFKNLPLVFLQIAMSFSVEQQGKSVCK